MINETTLEVYGYVVAADDCGGGYVIPILDAFREIKTTLGVEFIGLANTADMVSYQLRRKPNIVLTSQCKSPPSVLSEIDADVSQVCNQKMGSVSEPFLGPQNTLATSPSGTPAQSLLDDTVSKVFPSAIPPAHQTPDSPATTIIPRGSSRKNPVSDPMILILA